MLEPTQLNPQENKKPFDWGLIGSWLGGLIAVLIIGGVIYWCVTSSEKDKVEKQTTEAAKKIESDKQIKTNQEKFFADAQKYVDLNYPKWKVKGFHLDNIVIADLGEPKEFYNLLLTNGEKEQVIFVVSADFTLADGTTETKLYEPSKQTLENLKESEFKNKGVKEEKKRREESNARDNEPE